MNSKQNSRRSPEQSVDSGIRPVARPEASAQASFEDCTQVSARHNPLAYSRVTRIGYRFRIGNWDDHIRRLKQLRYRAAIVGPQGSGKTTLLEELSHRLSADDIPNLLVFLPHAKTDHGRLVENAVAAASTHVVLVDGLERVGWLRRNRLLRQTRRGPGLVVAVHKPSRLPTWIHCQTDQTLMNSILAELGLHHPDVITAGQIAFENANGNIREALRTLYDQFAFGRFNATLSS